MGPRLREDDGNFASTISTKRLTSDFLRIYNSTFF